MKVIFIVLTIFLSFLANAQTSEDSSFINAPLKHVLKFVEARYDVHFSYMDDNIAPETISVKINKQTVEEIMKEIFSQTSLTYNFIDEKNFTLSLRSELSEEFPNLCGFVKDAVNGDPLVGANIWIKGTDIGSSTNHLGRYTIKFQPDGSDTLIISYIGYVRLEISAIDAEEQPCRDYFLHNDEDLVAPVIIREYLIDGIGMPDGGNVINIHPQKLGAMPGLIESDIFSTMQLIPGITSPSETASGLFVRGGTPDQNLILWDGVPIYHTGHLFGMISAFNPYFIKNINVYRSGIASEYGGRASSVIDIQANDIPPVKWTGHAGLNMTHLHLSTEFPLWKKSGLQLSLRKNISETLLTPTFQRYAEKVFQGSKVDFTDSGPGTPESSDKFTFSDVHFKWLWNPGRSKLSASIFAGNNNLDYTSEIENYIYSRDILTLDNVGINLQWQEDWSDQYSTKLSLYNSDYNSDYSLNLSLLQDIENVLIKATRANTVGDGGIKFTNTWKPIQSHKLNFGYQYSEQNLNISIRNNDQDVANIEQTDFESKVHSIFSEYTFSTDLITLNAGVRYQKSETLDANYFAPRMSMHTKVNPHLDVKISSCKQFQFISQLVILDLNDIGVGNEIWIASDHQGIPVIESTQWAGGLLFHKNGWSVDVEGYVKELSGITTLSNGFSNITNQPFSQGSSNVRGIDILAKKQHKNWRSWVSYTLSKAEYEFKEIDENVFPASHDHLHSFQWVNVFKADPWEFSLGWQFRSGLPYTQANGIDTLAIAGQNFLYIDYAEQNSSRLKPYHRLDASVLYHFKSKGRFQGFFGVSFLNIYGRQNDLRRNFLIEDMRQTTGEVDLVQINRTGLKFTPNAVVKVRW